MKTQDLFIDYKEAKELKALGFNESCFGYYYTLNGKTWNFIEKHKFYELDEKLDIGSNFFILAPTFSQAFHWFESKYSIYIERLVDTSVNEILDFTYKIKSWKFIPIVVKFKDPYDCFNKEKADKACLKTIIEIAKKIKV